VGCGLGWIGAGAWKGNGRTRPERRNPAEPLTYIEREDERRRERGQQEEDRKSIRSKKYPGPDQTKTGLGGKRGVGDTEIKNRTTNRKGGHDLHIKKRKGVKFS